jgi:ferritin-like metal-binding protein YciE
MDNAQDLFEHELRDIYDAEHKLVRATATMADKATDKELSKVFAEHSKATEGQVKRLEKVFEAIDRAPRREACDGINGLIEEFTGFVKKENPKPEALDFFAIGAATKVEHYEIEAYKSLIALGGKLGIDCTLLTENLAEEEQAASELEALAPKAAGRLPLNSHG